MKKIAAIAVWAVPALVVVGSSGAFAQEMPQLPKPGPEHEILKQDAGTWDATVEAMMTPGQPPAVSKGIETNTLLGNGMWLVTDFKSDMAGQPFQGHGITGYDSTTKMYVGTWVDTMTPKLSPMEASYDPVKKTMTGYMEGPDPSGKVVKSKMVTTYTDPDTRVFTITSPGPDGKEVTTLKITYKRRK